ATPMSFWPSSRREASTSGQSSSSIARSSARATTTRRCWCSPSTSMRCSISATGWWCSTRVASSASSRVAKSREPSWACSWEDGRRMTNLGRPAIFSILGPVRAVLAALIVGGVIILVTGHEPITAYRAMFQGAFDGKRAIAETLIYTAPLLLGGLAFAVAYRASLFNIGVEGQLVVGGLAAG